MVMGDNGIDNDEKYRDITGRFDGHAHVDADAVVQCGVHRPMEHIQGFARFHWMPSLGECLHHIAPTAAMVDIFVENTKH